MARCPICGALTEVISSQGERRYFCSHCGLILKRKARKDDVIHGDLEVVDYIERVADSIERNSEDTGISERGRYTTIDSSPSSRSSPRRSETDMNRSPSRGEQFNWGHCNYCQAIIVLSNSKFCSNCGASLGQRLEDATPFEMKDKAMSEKNTRIATKMQKKCTVCNLELSEDDDVTWCPHCGNPAHRTHLLAWVHVKNSCPICGKHLTERDFTGS